MFQRQTLLVIGAGASAEVGLPVGDQLAKTIAKKLHFTFERSRMTGGGDTDLYDSFRRNFNKDMGEVHRAAQLIRDGIVLSSSIDDFLDIHRDDPWVIMIGKAAIARAVLEAERASKLYVNPSNVHNKINLNAVSDTWYVRFMRVLTRGRGLKEIGSIFDNLALIVFNYDRCVEHFLHQALQDSYGIDRNSAAKILETLKIIHPYGTVGKLTDAQSVFGGNADFPADYIELSARLRTYTEQTHSGIVLREIKKFVTEAEQIIYLGYAFHDQNVSLLQPPEKTGPKYFFGTAYGMSQSDLEEVVSEIASLEEFNINHMTKRSKINVNSGLTCSDLFSFYAKSLASGKPL